ncbi:MAG: Uma2 family endonuclease [Leptolyngbya sp. RL_3_1]|nr:Uma2 family endonuclease [Leptolyngbya sp. RL_3_1]
MVLASQRLTLEDYLAYADASETRHELVDGVLVEMPPESRLNARIAMFLIAEFLRHVPFQLLCCKDTELEVSGRLAKVRLPDLMLLTEELDQLLGTARGTITREMPPPQLIVEVVSPGKVNEDRDYRYKRSEYAARGVAEYWIVDPTSKIITILIWVEGLYEAQTFQGDNQLQSLTLPDLTLTAAQVFAAGQ